MPPNDPQAIIAEGVLAHEPFPFVKGTRLRVQNVGLPAATAPDLQLSQEDFHGALLALWCTLPDRGYVQGTAFLIAPGIALTAAHVVQEHLDYHGLGGAEVGLCAVGTHHGKPVNWRVTEIAMAENSDVAVLSLVLYGEAEPELDIYHFQLGTKLPSLGDFVRAVGMHSPVPEGRTDIDRATNFAGQLVMTTILSSGEVLDLYPHGRGNMLPNPGFSADVAILGGMSGGPVFDRSGRVVGIISTGQFDPGAVELRYGLISLIWATLWVDIVASWPPGMFPEPLKLVNLVEPYEGLRVQPGDGGRLNYIDFPMAEHMAAVPS